MFFKSMMNMVTNFFEKKGMLGLYSQDQINSLREVQDHYMRDMEEEEDRLTLMEGSVEGQIENDIMVGPSYSSSTWSPPASGGKVTAKIGLNKLGMPYFASLEKRLGIEEDEFFKKEEFDIEE